jgi:hypothetical protein
MRGKREEDAEAADPDNATHNTGAASSYSNRADI